MNLAVKLRPKNLNEICGQREIIEIFKKFVLNGKIPHSIFFGPAGSGKTTLAKVLCNELGYQFYELDASNLKVDDIRKIIEKHKEALYKPLIFIDEIHRLSKTQQEVLLIPMENYQAQIIGATTENPQFVLSSGIRSRSMLFEFKHLNDSDFEILLNRAKKELDFTIDDDAKKYLLKSSGGDARAFLNLLEFSLSISKNITLKTLKILRSNSISEGVSNDDTHYGLASAFIKSMRGSDVEASIYYLARLIDAGESADFIARRMVILASEDIGNANPGALNMAVNTMQAVSKIGFPEARIILSQCAIYLASSPKSNSSYEAINNALNFVKNGGILEIPKYLINSDKAHKDYLYPHDFGGWVEQIYADLPIKFYNSKNIGFEKTLSQWLEKIKDI